MVIKTYPLGIYEENIYVLVDEKSRDACIVDPGGNGDILIKNIDLLNCNVKYILLTHGHFDHVEALKEVAEKYNLVEDGDTLPFGDGVIKCIHTPGHTKGGMCYLYKDALFTGDTLFKGSVGRSDFIGGNFNELITSIKTKLMILDDNIKVYPGHMESSSIGFERLNNPFLKDEFDIF